MSSSGSDGLMDTGVLRCRADAGIRRSVTKLIVS
jgi:hypothetical protein